MDEPRNLGLAAALASGYLLGRTKKGQMALTAAAVLAGRGLRPGSALAAGVRRVPGLPGAKDDGDDADDGGRQGSGGARRGLARKAADRGLNALTEALRERTRSLSPDGADEQENPPDEGDGDWEDEDPAEEEAEDAAQDDDAEEDEVVPPRRSAGRPGEKSAKKPAARKPAARKPAARRAPESAQEPARAKKAKKPAAPAKPPSGRSGAAGKGAPKAKPTAKGRPAKKTASRSKRDR